MVAVKCFGFVGLKQYGPHPWKDEEKKSLVTPHSNNVCEMVPLQKFEIL